MFWRIVKWVVGVPVVLLLIGVLTVTYAIRWDIIERLSANALTELVLEDIASQPPQQAIPRRHDLRAWRDKVQDECTDRQAVQDSDANDRRLACQDRLNLARARFLQAPRDTLIVTGTAEDRAVCERMLARERLVWVGRGRSTEDFYQARQLFADSFEYVLPDGLEQVAPGEAIHSTPGYRIEKVKFDLAGSGTPQDVYQVVALTDHAYVPKSPGAFIAAPSRKGVIWFVRPVAGEADAIEAAFRITLSYSERDNLRHFENLATLSASFGGAVPRDLNKLLKAYNPARDPLIATAPYFRSQWLAPPLLPDLSAEMLPTTMTPFRIGKTSYILAGNGFGVLVLFRPVPGEPMHPICRWTATSSRIELAVTQFSADLACPYQEAGAMREIDWPQGYPQRTLLDLPEWGGRRPLIRVQAAHGYPYPHVFVGALGADKVEAGKNRQDHPADHWAPMFAAYDHHEVLLKQLNGRTFVVTRDQPYPYDRRLEMPTTYYQVGTGTMIPVCRVESRVVPPMGYKVAP